MEQWSMELWGPTIIESRDYGIMGPCFSFSYAVNNENAMVLLHVCTSHV